MAPSQSKCSKRPTAAVDDPSHEAKRSRTRHRSHHIDADEHLLDKLAASIIKGLKKQSVDLYKSAVKTAKLMKKEGSEHTSGCTGTDG